MRVFLLLFFLIILSLNSAFAEETQTPAQPQSMAYQTVPYQDCTKMFDIDKEKLFYLTLGAINANRFTTDEIQTENGYILFTANRGKYLATIAGIDKANSILKIAPCNNLYYFQPIIINNIYKFIDLNKNNGNK